MAWSVQRAEQRILRSMETAPTIAVDRYNDDFIQRTDLVRQAARIRRDFAAADAPPLFNLGDGRAVLVDTVQLYVRALNYDDVRLENGRETEASHARALSLLHLLYSASDRVVERNGGQRVDHHGARMHAVILEPRGDSNVL